MENISRDVRELDALEELDELDDEVTESSLVTCNRFCCGTGEGLIGDSWAAAVCILKKSFENLLLVVVAWGGRYASNGWCGLQSGPPGLCIGDAKGVSTE